MFGGNHLMEVSREDVSHYFDSDIKTFAVSQCCS